MTARLVKVSCNLIPAARRAMNDAAGITGLNSTDTINRALQVYALITKAASEGQEVYFKAPDGTIRQIIIT